MALCRRIRFIKGMSNQPVPLEDELGDVLDKAMRLAGLTPAALAARTGVSSERILDALDYRYEFSRVELEALACALGLAAVGLGELASGHYPLPVVAGLPFCLHPLRSPHGIGTANAYLVTDCRRGDGVLFDTGPDPARLRALWPEGVARVAAIFLTHAEAEHTGALSEAQRLFGPAPVFAPRGAKVPGATGLADGARMDCAGYAIETLSTPGHAEAHNAYLVSSPRAPLAPALLIGGDLLFAGSIGGGYFCTERQRTQVVRVFSELPPGTVIAPGHGPLTTLAHELAHNPFAPLVGGKPLRSKQ